MSQAEVTLPAAVSSVPTARHFIESILSGWGLTELAWPATMIVSELASNAALHARGQQFSVRITTSGTDGVRLEVTDSSMRLPQQRSYSSEATTGRGLRLVAALAASWGVTPGERGKTIWAVLHPVGDTGDSSQEADVHTLLDAFDDNDMGEAAASVAGGRPRACCLGAV
ncbi:MAG: hypothetical protein NVSMB55_09120 [Mycobacteriales bacterium]